jgi:predicted DsbA family dithiol-disulfide isomerase
VVVIEIFSDTICPWCFIAKRRLEQALRVLDGRIKTEVRWLPFELNPGMPANGIPRRVSRSSKFGTWEQAVALDAQVAAVGRLEGLEFVFDRIERTPNTLDSHRLIALARREGNLEPVVEAIFRAYFLEARDLSDRSTLLDIAAESGLDRARAAGLLASEEGIAETRAEEARARAMGVKGVPYFVLNGRHVMSGARDSGSIVKALEVTSATTESPARLTTDPGSPEDRYGFPRTRCGCDFCSAYCRHIPGRLGVFDPARLCPQGQDVFAWAEQHLQAVIDRPFPKLVPVKQANGHCHWYIDGKCTVHENAPYGCAYFDAHMSSEEVKKRSKAADQASLDDAKADGLHYRIWRHLRDRGLTRSSGDRAPLEVELLRIRLSMQQS